MNCIKQSILCALLLSGTPIAFAQGVSCKAASCIPIMLQSISPLNEPQLNATADLTLNKDSFLKGNRKEARKLNDDALKDLASGNAQGAVLLLKQAAETDPSDVEINSNYGFALLKSGNYNAAKAQLQKTLELNPRRTSTWLPLAEAYAGAGQAQMANQAGLIAYYYSTDKAKAKAYYQKQSQEQASGPIRSMYVSLINETGKLDTAQPATSVTKASEPPVKATPTAPTSQAVATAPPPKPSKAELVKRAANAIGGPDGWGRCISANVSIMALSIRDKSMPAHITKANDELGVMLGEIRKYYLANGMPDSVLGQYIKAWGGRITSGDQAWEIVHQCYTTIEKAL